VQALLRVLAAGHRRAGEIGTAFGKGGAAIAQGLPPGGILVTVELDRTRAQVAREELAPFPNVRLIEGDWHQLATYAPFDLLFVDVHEAKTDPVVLELVEPGGLVVIDDMTPGPTHPRRRPPVRAARTHRRRACLGRTPVGLDPIREFWLRNPRVAGAEILTTRETGAILATRLC
jgi:predicted O-methyltransferase YrrM